jgi:tRNA A37 threonylcarbamoyladenosine dehydratase
MRISVKIDRVYGKEMIYPSCNKAKLLCQLSNKKTFSEQEINLIKDLGYTVLVTSTSGLLAKMSLELKK